MVQTWILLAVAAALFWGAWIIAAKVAMGEKYFGINPAYASLFVLAGIAVVILGNIAIEGFSMPKSMPGIAAATVAGALWALGMVASFKALQAGADVAKLTPLYNTNTLVAVVLGIILLHELPQAGQMVKVVVGALLIVVGSVLVAG